MSNLTLEQADIIWNRHFEMAKSFYEKNGHLNIPCDYMANGINLGRWITSQRSYYKTGKNVYFTKKRILKLQSIGMIWDTKENNWNRMYLELVKYKEKYNTVRVPQSYVTKDGLKLGYWVNGQRLKYHRKKLSLNRKKMLDELGMIWNAKKLVYNSWDMKFSLLKKYKNTYGVFPVYNYVTEDGIKLGYWMNNQVHYYKKGKLLDDRKKKLESIGFIWSKNVNIWNNYYNMAKKHYLKNGNLYLFDSNSLEDNKLSSWITKQRRLFFQKKLDDNKIKMLEDIGMVWYFKKDTWDNWFNIATDYYVSHGNLNPSRVSDDIKERKLRSWLDTQRKNYKNNKNWDVVKIKKLESIGMIWNLKKSSEEIWNDWYNKAKDFYNTNKHLNPKRGQLNTWILAQRAAKRGLRGKLTNKQIKLLEEIGMVWNPKDDRWNKMYNLAYEYYKIHRMLNVPVNYVTEEGFDLGGWISRQRTIYKDRVSCNNISIAAKRKINLLNEIGMIWDASTLITMSSFPEKVIYYYLKKKFTDVTKVSYWDFIGYELDIYIPSISVAIEYDGQWHNDSLEADNKKNQACIDNDIKLIRIREPGLVSINGCYKIYKLKDTSEKELENCIKWLFSLLGLIECDCNINRDRRKILTIYKDYVSHSWDLFYEKIYRYTTSGKNINGITSDKSADKSLKYWFNSQKSAYKNDNLTDLQINKLESLGIDWGPNETKWMKMYNLAYDYYSKHGNLEISCYYVDNNGVKLGSWISKQRCKYKKGQLDLKKINLLTRIGMIWNLKRETSKRYVEALKNYYKRHNSINIKYNYVTKDGLYLGRWLSKQKSRYRAGTLNIELKSLLEQFGIKNEFFKYDFDKMYDVAYDYYKKFGNIWISPNYVTEEGIRLGGWISDQRTKFNKKAVYTKNELDRRKKLDDIGMVWYPYDEKWMRKYKLAKEYYEKYGNLNIPVDYITVTGEKLGMWISSQRQAMRGNPNFLMTPERKQLLDEIGMKWELKFTKVGAKTRH